MVCVMSNSSTPKRGRRAEGRVRLVGHVLPKTAAKVKRLAAKATIGKVIDSKFP